MVRNSAVIVSSWKDTAWIRARSQSDKVEIYCENVLGLVVAGLLCEIGVACIRAMEGKLTNFV
jgi:hypothetical protein